jgi:hypothetical protein
MGVQTKELGVSASFEDEFQFIPICLQRILHFLGAELPVPELSIAR